MKQQMQNSLIWISHTLVKVKSQTSNQEKKFFILRSWGNIEDSYNQINYVLVF